MAESGSSIFNALSGSEDFAIFSAFILAHHTNALDGKFPFSVCSSTIMWFLKFLLKQFGQPNMYVQWNKVMLSYDNHLSYPLKEE